jgi:lysyl-tRNA synthetase class I
MSLTSTTRSPLQRESLRQLIEQAADYSGAASDDLVAQRIADQEARIELMTKRRKETLQSTNSVRGEET